jgi:hypothetical protein
VNSVASGYQRGNRDAALAVSREVTNLQEEVAQMLTQARRFNLSLQQAGQAENRRLLYLTEAGNAMLAELGILFLLPNRNELPLRRSLERYGSARQILESEFQQ